MRSVRLLQVAFLFLVFLVSVVVTAPARLLIQFLPDDQLLVQGVSGTLWQGTASRAMVKLPAGYLHLGRVSWSLQPASLLTFAPVVDVISQWGDQRVKGELQWHGAGSVTLRDFDATVEANLLRLFAPVALEGKIVLQLQSLALRDNVLSSGQGRVVWERGAWQAPRGPLALGTYALDFEQSEGQPLLGEIITVSGAVQAQGDVTVEGSSYGLNIRVRSDEPLDSQLKEALALMAAPEEDGYRLKLEGQF